MIKANELRIGNIIFGEKKIDSGIVKSIDSIVKIELPSGHEDYFSPEQLNPIPLTEEWLEKFGFEKDAIRIYRIQFNSVNKFLAIPLDEENEARIEMPFGNGIMTIAKNIYFVHQLQNLYFALTGEELIIAPEMFEK